MTGTRPEWKELDDVCALMTWNPYKHFDATTGKATGGWGLYRVYANLSAARGMVTRLRRQHDRRVNSGPFRWQILKANETGWYEVEGES